MATYSSASAYWNARKAREVAKHMAKGLSLDDAKRAQRADYVKPLVPFRCSGASICKICCVCGDH